MFRPFYRSSSDLHTLESSNAMLSHHVHIYKIFKINYASQLKSDWETLLGWR